MITLHKNKKKIIYSLAANGFQFLISVLMVLILPKVMSVDDYGYWQLYLFYLAYVGIFPLGWLDGISLRYVGMEYAHLDKRQFAGQLYSFIILEIMLAVLVCIWGNSRLTYPTDIIIQSTAIVGIAFVVNTFVSFVLQATARVDDYSRLLVLERILFCTGITIGIIFGVKSWTSFILVSFCAHFFCMLYALYVVKDITLAKPYRIKKIFAESLCNIFVGMQLMIANLASMLILGTARFGISLGWDITTFGKISLALGISSFLIVFINAVSVVLFPIIKKMDEAQRIATYKLLKDILSVVLLFLLGIYYPTHHWLLRWLPDYADGIKYIVILLPVCVFESKIMLLNNTYLKSLRKESLLLKINICAAALSLILTFVSVKIFWSLELAVGSILLVFIFRYMLAEYFLSKLFQFDVWNSNIRELLLVFVFICAFWNIGGYKAECVYLLAYLLYVFNKRKDVRCLINSVREWMSDR